MSAPINGDMMWKYLRDICEKHGLGKPISMDDFDERLGKALVQPEAARTGAYVEFATCVRSLVNGGNYDLTDSPKSLIGNLQRFVRELDEAISKPQVER